MRATLAKRIYLVHKRYSYALQAFTNMFTTFGCGSLYSQPSSLNWPPRDLHTHRIGDTLVGQSR